MIQSKTDYKKYLKIEKEVYNYSYPKFTKELKTIYKFIKLYRKVEYYYNCRKDIFGKIYYYVLKHILEKKSLKYSIFLPINSIEEGLCIIHLGPIFINNNVKIGKYLKIHPMTVIGKTIGFNQASPKIGDKVWIGPGVKIYGDIKLGNNIVIGANSVVNKSFRDNMTIAGVPAKKISSKTYRDYFKK